MILVTSHFKLDEFSCKDGTPYPSQWIESRLLPHCNMLEVVREDIGHPLTILCGYRSPAYNDRLRQRGLKGERGTTGVAEHSRHMDGDATDIVCYGMSVQELHDRILRLYTRGLLPTLGGLGLYLANGWVHVDNYQTGHLRRWTG